MDLAKIIADLKVELQYLDTAIASIEELVRVQSSPDGHIQPPTDPDPEPSAADAAPAKRRRGRPRKNFPLAAQEPPQPISGAYAPATDDSEVSAA